MNHSMVGKIYTHFENITDPRVNRGKNYCLLEMVFITLCATICGASDWVDVERYGKAKLSWLRKYFPLDNGIPSHDTFSRVFSRLETVEFYAALQSWSYDIAQTLKGKHVAIDGKTLRGSHDRALGKPALHSVSAWVQGLKLCIGLKSVDDKSNEIPAAQQLIDMLELQGAIVTLDAMHCQKQTVRKLYQKEADYLICVKGNQPTLNAEVDKAILAAFEVNDKRMRRCEIQEENRGRKETRSVTVMPCPRGGVFKGWDGLKTIGVIHRTREINGKYEEEVSTFMTSLPCRVRAIAGYLRGHWGIENSQHYILDVTFREDASRIRKGNGPEITSVFRRLCLNILQQDTSINDNIKGKRARCSWDNSAIEAIIAGFSEA